MLLDRPACHSVVHQKTEKKSLLPSLTSDMVMMWSGGEHCATCFAAASSSATWAAWRPTRTNSAVVLAPPGRQE